MQQNPTGCLHMYFFPKKLCISLQFFNCWMLFQPWPVPAHGTTEVQRNLEQLLAKWNKRRMKKGQITQTCSLSLPFSNRAPCRLKSPPQKCRTYLPTEHCTLIFGSMLYSRYLSIIQLCPDQAGQNFWNYIPTHTHTHTLHLNMKTKLLTECNHSI